MKASFSTERTALSPRVRRFIDNIHEEKRRITLMKNRDFHGKLNSDDWGYVYYPDWKFDPPPSTRPDGVIAGYVPIAKTLRKFVNDMPTYVNKNSALGGAWVRVIAEHANIRVVPEDQPEHLFDVWGKYATRPGCFGMNHCAGDMEIGLKLGWGGLLEKVRRYRRVNDPVDTSFYDGEEEIVLGMQEYAALVAAKAGEMARGESDPDWRRNLLDIAEINRKLVYAPPDTFREACQFVAHFQTIDRIYYAGGALDQIDRFLLPYYEKDTREGRLTDEEAVWCLASLFFNDTHYSQIAGLNPDGSRDTASRLSFLVLDAIHYLAIPVNMALRVHDGVNPALLRRALEYILEDGSGVSFSLNIGCEQGYARNGYPLGLARQRIKVGCNWTAIPGREYPLQDVTRANMGMALHWALKDVKDGDPSGRTLENLFERFAYHVKVIVDSIKEGYDWHYERVSRNTPELIYNLFMHGPVERGLNCAEGGVDILNFNIDGVALATVADSFAAIEQRVVNEKRVTWDEMFDALDRNWEGLEDTRLMMKNIQRFGAPGSLAEKWALRARDHFVNVCKSSGTPKHNLPIIPGMFSHGTILELGKELPATPNGRFAGEEISHSAEPDPGFASGLNSFSPSLKATAVAKVQPGYGNSSPLHLDIDREMLRREGGIDALVQLIHAHNHMGGTLINMNCLSKEQLLAAHEKPELYPDLVVRVTGYSAFFVTLSKEYRQQVVDRFLA
ncbi:MAG: pyruvate-formate lyase [Oscillospiraceae bacterium]|jgi:formate C-acetyltransferase|nr:pyruvate-formate lyase [Oscillospiraceae bacterium]